MTATLPDDDVVSTTAKRTVTTTRQTWTGVLATEDPTLGMLANALARAALAGMPDDSHVAVREGDCVTEVIVEHSHQVVES